MEMLRALVGSFLACFAFSFILNTRGKPLFYAPLGGSICWVAFCLFTPFFPELGSYFLATVVVSVYAELMARVHKAPVTVFLLVGLLPLVPGGGIYYTMEHALAGDTLGFLSRGLDTFGIAGSLALGVLVVSSTVRFIGIARHRSSPAKQRSDS